MSPSSNEDLIRACFAAYEDKDRPAIEAILSKDFTFTSPVDDCISRQSYFERCWPNSEHLKSFEIESILTDGADEATVRYTATTITGEQFRNTETFTIRDGKISHVDVYFGSDTAESVHQSEIESVIHDWADGIRRKDVDAVADQFVENAVGFYLAPPLQSDMPIRKNLRQWFATFDGPIGYEVKELHITASGGIGWAYAFNHLTGTKTDGDEPDLWFRLTLCFQKNGDRWKIVHAHESVPFLMDGSEKAALHLTP